LPAGLVFDVQRQSLEQYIMLMEASVELTPEERRRIYEEEKARIDTERRQVHEEEKARIEAEQSARPPGSAQGYPDFAGAGSPGASSPPRRRWLRAILIGMAVIVLIISA